MIPFAWIEDAQRRIAPHIRTTPISYDPRHKLFIKWENQQVTGSFKARGALNKVLTLQDWERQRGIVTASAGNHGQGVALAGQITGARVLVFCAESAVPAKLMAMRKLGAELHLVPGGYAGAEAAGLDFARQEGLTWVSAYNDGQVIAGQGTLALEALEQIPELESAAWLAPVSGGGLLAGTAAALKSHPGPARVLGVQTHASPHMHHLFYHGTQQDAVELPSIADGLAGPVEDGSVTIPLIRQLVDDIHLVDEDELRQAIRYAWTQYEQVIEPSGAATLAAALFRPELPRPLLAIISGGNIQPELHAEICA